LRERLATAIRNQDVSDARTPRVSRAWWWPVGVAFACGALLSWIASSLLSGADAGRRIDGEVVSAHVRAVMMARATDVVSSDQHTVKPWLSSRLDFSPPVHDLAAAGFPLAGGRIDYVAGRLAAVLVYRRNEHWIDVFVWPSGHESVRTGQAARNGFNVIGWVDGGGMQYRAVSDVGASDLAAFAEALQRRIAAGT
jgi:anti-sigma factor RsiW